MGLFGCRRVVLVGGLLVVVFATGPALFNPRIRNLGASLSSEAAMQVED